MTTNRKNGERGMTVKACLVVFENADSCLCKTEKEANDFVKDQKSRSHWNDLGFKEIKQIEVSENEFNNNAEWEW
ncbi:MAG: hypothetical protein CME63_01470 [Halobacteriovoraceae bacterium]|nr:hypothetical protein [Halobacteriovoraceae bacterium]|tara:strand:+ start:23625 stop:23849 length:225 start_codon:yes stop_codon:yes gene_type:complete